MDPSISILAYASDLIHKINEMQAEHAALGIKIASNLRELDRVMLGVRGYEKS